MKLLDRLRSDIYINGGLYMARWLLGPDWLPGIRLHHIIKSDPDREFHDHQWDFISIGLWGSYIEHYHDGTWKTFQAPFINIKSAECLHRLDIVKPVWTLVFRSRVRRRWGFLTGGKWEHWTDFVKDKPGLTHVIPFAAKSSTGGSK